MDRWRVGNLRTTGAPPVRIGDLFNCGCAGSRVSVAFLIVGTVWVLTRPISGYSLRFHVFHLADR